MPGPIHSDPNIYIGGTAQPSDLGDALAPLQGQYRGEQVSVQQDVQSLLEDSAEEMTFQHGERKEKDLGRRALTDAKRKQQHAIGVRETEKILDKIKDLPKRKLDEVVAKLRLMQNAQSQELRQRAREELPEPGHQYAALTELAERLRNEGAPAERIAAAEQALRDLENDLGPEIRAALNVSEIASDYAAEKLGDLQSLRDTYRDVALDSTELGQTLQTLIERYGEPELPRSIQFLIKSLGADLASEGTSVDPVKLNSVLSDLYRLETLTSMLEDCATLVERNRAPGIEFKASDLLGEVLALQGQTWLRPELISPLPQKLGVADISAQIGVLREFKTLVRDIPLQAYAEPDQRSRLLDAIQEAMDAAIDFEETGES